MQSRRMIGIGIGWALTIGCGAAAASAVADNAAKPWPLAETFAGRPARAVPRPGSSCDVAARYVSFIDSQHPEKIGALWAEDAVFLDPFGVLVKGRPAIAKWFVDAAIPKNAVPLSFIDSGPDCFMEIAGVMRNSTTGQYGLTAIDHFTLDEKGEIRRAVYYFRPPTIRAVDKAMAAAAH